ncbi:zinc finger BED domain-containing protein RICESLEEPER 2-like [Rhododendron vialii]|uniref:zinc finger BED domain-containing protein RICESLEEPER 2-like n=1 Tax=Rhododendron vialii TaxID=182163 RepID=UPI00266007C5|nr:zinc finger BED domain-containing protein RICESLEEPER 2-like [Rhododendron vialii]
MVAGGDGGGAFGGCGRRLCWSMVVMDTNPTMESIHSQSAHSPPEKGVAKAKSKKSPLKKAKKPILKRKRRLTSEVWKYFDILDKPKKENLPDNENDPENPDDDENDPENPDDVIVDDEPEKCKCKKCGQVYLSDSKYGTGNMKRHLLVCLKNQTMDIGQMLVSKNGALQLAKFNPDRFRELLVHAVVRHDLPLSFVEYEGVRNIFTYLNPEAHSISRRTVRTAILSLHEKEYRTLGRNLRTLPGRVCLTSDLWTSIATDGYMSLTAHFIDANWVLHKRLLNFSYTPPPHSGVALKEKVYDLLVKWGIVNKLFSFTLDNASANDVLVDLLKNHLNLNSALVDEGSCFHSRCCAHILNLVVQMGLKEIDVVVDKIRECVKYMKGSQARKQKLLECVAQYSLDSKRGLRQDVPTRWNSTYLMLASAIYYRRAFCQLQLSDSNFKHCPSQEEWGRAEKICQFLKVFYDATCIFSGSKYPTSNLYFPKHSVILAIAVISDPRFKFQLVEYSYGKLYGESSSEVFTQCTRIREKLFGLFNEYQSKAYKPEVVQGNVVQENQGEFIEDFDAFESHSFVSSAHKNQLELYLDEPRLPRNENIDVLEYWRAHNYRYPELASMARDVLSIPISTVASESAFSVGGRVLDKYRSSLKPKIVEALICSRDWLFGGEEIDNVKLDDVIEDIMNLNLDNDQSESVGCSSSVINVEP